mmetsp:Transcript_46026/g.81652  ORF Transcript_46026/g.81652 Transcript_46026/m.81652 type:complete len:513 (+) Transcript_46026:36-1574(+)
MLSVELFPGVVPLDPLQAGASRAVVEPIAGNFTHEYPSRWLDLHSQAELDASRLEASGWAEEVREAARHAWSGYRERAWGYDQIHPKSGEPNHWYNLGLSIIEWLDTLWLLGMRSEFEEATDWVTKSLIFETAETKLDSFFEATIRLLGGLLGAHALTQRTIFLIRAKELGDRLISAWSAEGDLPYSEVDISKNVSKHVRWNGQSAIFGTAEVGTCQLEFRYLSYHTGDPTYAAFADRAFTAILDAAPNKGLVSIYLQGSRFPIEWGSQISMGARGDSYYEYLLKQYLQTSQTEEKFLERWKLAMEEMMQRLVRRSRDGYVYVGKEMDGKMVHEFDHLSCFVAGMLVQGLHELPGGTVPESYGATAAEITKTCWAMYGTKSGMPPEIVDFSNGRMQIKDADAFSLLRPEAAEAMYYMWYYTGDHKYRQWASGILRALNRSTRTDFGFSSIEAVDSDNPRLKDMCESFFFAETLKYLYLIQVDPHVLPLDQFVFNTEGHPLKIFSEDDMTSLL